MPGITDLWLSGGEPTLRRDVPEIIETFVKKNGVQRVIIPTNGLIKARVYEIVDRALGDHPKLDLYLNIALDGYGKTHDQIRGVPGNWEKALDCISSLYPLKAKFADRFRLNVNTVVCADNYTEIEQAGRIHVGKLQSRRPVFQHRARRDAGWRRDQASARRRVAKNV